MPLITLLETQELKNHLTKCLSDSLTESWQLILNNIKTELDKSRIDGPNTLKSLFILHTIENKAYTDKKLSPQQEMGLRQIKTLSLTLITFLLKTEPESTFTQLQKDSNNDILFASAYFYLNYFLTENPSPPLTNNITRFKTFLFDSLIHPLKHNPVNQKNTLDELLIKVINKLKTTSPTQRPANDPVYSFLLDLYASLISKNDFFKTMSKESAKKIIEAFIELERTKHNDLVLFFYFKYENEKQNRSFFSFNKNLKQELDDIIRSKKYFSLTKLAKTLLYWQQNPIKQASLLFQQAVLELCKNHSVNLDDEFKQLETVGLRLDTSTITLGKGGFGIVYQSTTTPNRAIKIVPYLPKKKNETKDEANKQQLMQECQFYLNNKHDHIIPLYSYAYTKLYFILVFPIYKMDLFLALFSNNNAYADLKNDDAKRTALLTKLLEALCFLSKKNIYLFDFKPENILLDDKGNPVIADVGNFAVFFPNPHKKIMCPYGTLAYSPIESLQAFHDRNKLNITKHQAEKIAVFLFGITAFMILTLEQAYAELEKPEKDKEGKEIRTSLTRKIYTFLYENGTVYDCAQNPKKIPPIAKMLVRNNPDRRPTFSTINDDKFFQSARSDTIIDSKANSKSACNN